MLSPGPAHRSVVNWAGLPGEYGFAMTRNSPPGESGFAVARAPLDEDAIAAARRVVEYGAEVDVVLGADVLAEGGDLLDDQLGEVVIQICSQMEEVLRSALPGFDSPVSVNRFVVANIVNNFFYHILQLGLLKPS